MIKSNYHTHAKYCHHAAGEIEDYVKVAIENNFDELGISDHNPIIENIVDLYGLESLIYKSNMDYQDVDNYLDDINIAKNNFKNQIKIYSAFECEFLPKGIKFYQKLRKKVDYLILGIHYFDYKGQLINTYKDLNYQNLDGYVEASIKGMESKLFVCLAHPDLFMINYKNINGERKFDQKAIEASKKIIEAAIKNDVYLELNANGLRDDGAYLDYHEWKYPSLEFWKIAKNYSNLKIIIGADAHNPQALCNINIKKVLEFANMLNLKIEDHLKLNL